MSIRDVEITDFPPSLRKALYEQQLKECLKEKFKLQKLIASIQNKIKQIETYERITNYTGNSTIR